MNRRLFLGHVLAAVGAVASVPLLTKLLPLPFSSVKAAWAEYESPSFGIPVVLCQRCGKVHKPFDLERDYVGPAARAMADEIDRRAYEFSMSQATR